MLFYDFFDIYWWTGEWNGKTGLFPSNYVELVKYHDADHIPDESTASKRSVVASSTLKKPTATARFTFDAEKDGDLHFPKVTKVVNIVSQSTYPLSHGF